MSEDSQIKLYTLLCCLCFIPSIILFGSSFGVVNVLENAIIYDKQTSQLDFNKLYGPGRYWTGLGRSFASFPTTVQTLRFGDFRWFTDTPSRGHIECRSLDGMQLFMEVAVQYRLSSDPEDLARLFYDFGRGMDGINGLYSDVSEKVVRDVASTYFSTEFFTKRAQIQRDIHTTVDKDLKHIYGECVSVQLMNMEFDKKHLYAAAIETTQIAKQDILEKQHEMQVAIVKAEAEWQSAQITSNVKISLAESEYNVTIRQAEADAIALLHRTQQQIEGYTMLKQKLGFNTSADLLAFLWMDAVKNDAGKVLMSMPLPGAVLGQPTGNYTGN